MKALIFLTLLDLAQPTETFLGKVLWVLEGYSSYITRPTVRDKPKQVHMYWASPGTVRAALWWALAGEPADKPMVAGYSMLDVDDAKVARVDRAFRARFGVPLVKRRKNGFTEYDGEGLRTAFRAIYLPPTPRTKKLYQPLRGFVASSAYAAACVLSHRRQMERMARRYAASGEYRPEDFACVDPESFVTVGVILRRHLDGTLPVLLESLRTVLRDYDPETFAELDTKLTN
jgi:hypothetical protein